MQQWQPVDVRGDPDVAVYPGNPADLVDAAGLLEVLLHRPGWHARAACRGQGPSTWFPTRGEPLEPARAVCDGCPVKAECFHAALGFVYGDDQGVWAGTSRKQRRLLRHTVGTDAA